MNLYKQLKNILEIFAENTTNLPKRERQTRRQFDGFWDMTITELLAALNAAGYEPDFDYISAEYKNPELTDEYKKLLEGFIYTPDKKVMRK
jgi:hypothetical protein